MVRRIAVLLVALSGLGLGTAAATGTSARLQKAPRATAEAPRRAATPRLEAKRARVEPQPSNAFPRLPPLRISSPNAHAALTLRLYDDQGRIDEANARKLDTLLADCRDPEHVQERTLERRTLQLLYRAAYHFRATEVEVVSAYRAPGRRREGPHGTGRAIDFKLKGVKAATLAAYLRTLPKVGVGVYTHRKTQYVHLDVRERSYHWLDASPPGRTWRERRLPDSSIVARDTRYTPESDWPEGARPSQDAISSSHSDSTAGSGEDTDHG
jgi:uncharacterized protein YcbK (DUF882 family)